MAVFASQLIGVVNIIGAAEAETQLVGVATASDRAAARLQTALVGGAAMAGVALIAVGVKSVEMAGNFEQSTNTLVTSAGLSRSSIDAVRQGILTMAVDTATGTDQLVKGMFNVQSALHLGASGLLVLKAAAEGAKAENSDLAQTTDVLTTAMVNYHLSASQAVSTMNSLIVTVAQGKMHMDDLTGSLKNVLPVSAAFHIKLSDVEGALATMANAGDRGTSAGTHLAMMFKMLSSPTGAAAKEMKSMGLDSIKLAETMRTSLPDALKMIQDAVSSHFTPGSVEYNRAILAILGGSKSGLAGLEIFGQGLKALGINTDDAAAALRRGGKDVENWDVIQGNFNFKLGRAREVIDTLMIRLGTGLLPVVGRMADGLATAAAYVGDFSQHSGVLVPILAGMGAVLAAVLVPAVWALAAGVIAATWPFLAIGLAVAGLTAIFQHFYTTNAPFKAFIDGIIGALGQAANVIMANIGPALQRLGSITSQVATVVGRDLVTAWNWLMGAISTVSGVVNTIAGVFNQLMGTAHVVAAALAGIGVAIYSTVLPYVTSLGAIIRAQFIPVWAQLMATWQAIQPLLAQLGGVFRMLWATIQQLATVFMAKLMPTLRSTAAALSALWSVIGPALLPGLKMLGIVIGGVLLVSLGLLVGVLIGVTGALARFLSGVIQVVQGVTQVFTGLAQFFSGILSFIVDLFTGHFEKLSGDLGMIWQGILNILQGAMTAMIGIFNASFGVILGFVEGFTNGVISFFTTLYHQLVGGSIVPDMCNGIIHWFATLGARALALVASLMAGVIGQFLSLASRAISAATSLVSGVVGQFLSLAGRAGSAVQGAVNTIISILQGAVGRAISAGANIVNGIAQGIRNGIGAVAGAIGSVVSFISSHLPSSPAKIGPLRELPHMGQQITAQIAEGMLAGLPSLRSALSRIVAPISLQVSGSASTGASGSAFPYYAFPMPVGGGGSTPVVHVHNDNRVYLDGHEMAGVIAPQVVHHLRRKTGVRV